MKDTLICIVVALSVLLIVAVTCICILVSVTNDLRDTANNTANLYGQCLVEKQSIKDEYYTLQEELNH